MSAEETTGVDTPGLCRSCAADVTPSVERCPKCGSPRLLRHPELNALAIAHIDCDAFYASVEKRDDPSLRDKPVIVGGGQRGVVSAACYVARIRGIHSAMPMFKALEACPDAVVVRPDMAKYAAVGGEVRKLMQETTPSVEPLSIDEAFLDLTGTERLHAGSPAKTLVRLIMGIERNVGVTASVGLSHNKFLAKLASDMDKPRGFTVIGRNDTLDLLAQQPVHRMWGVGKALHRHLKADGIATMGQLRQYDEATLVKRYGSIGQRLYRFSRGEDYRRVTPQWPAKSLSTETTFFDDVSDFDELARRMWPLCERLSERLKAKELSGRTITLKLKTKGFRLLTRSHTLPAPTQLAETLYQTALGPLRKAADGTAYRLIGVGASMLHAAAEADPPDLADPDAGKRKRVETAMDAVRARLGREAIVKGRGFTTRERA